MKIAFFQLEEREKEEINKNENFIKFGAENLFFDSHLNSENVPENEDIEVVSVFIDSDVNKEVLDKLPKLKLIATRSTGFDHVDIEECKKRGVVVSNVPSYGENTVAEHTFALILTLSRKIYDAYNRVRETVSFSFEGLRGFDLKEKTLGVIGTGRIGRNVVRMAKGFEMNILSYDAHPDEGFAKESGLKYVSLEELLKESDIITLHVPYMEETHHLINESNINFIKKGAYLINTSRGGVVSTQALLKALQEGILAGAGLDVLEEEGAYKDELGFLTGRHHQAEKLKTVLSNHVLIDLPNVIITPHNAFNTNEGVKRIFETTVENIISFLQGSPKNTVN